MHTSYDARLLVAVLLLGAALTGCSLVVDDSRDGRFYGPAVEVGDGTARTYVETGADGQPLTVGVALSADALDGLPAGHGDHDESVFILRFPEAAAVDGFLFDHVALGWNPNGHEPDGLFTHPHFDFHFNMVPHEEIMTWTPDDPLFAEKGERVPEAKYTPAGYILPPGPAVPMMGNHLVDTTDPTYAPGGPTFSEVLIWGVYDGDIIFVEPMITKAFFESRPHIEETMAQPQAFERRGLYPTTYRVTYDAGRNEYQVELDGLTLRDAG